MGTIALRQLLQGDVQVRLVLQVVTDCLVELHVMVSYLQVDIQLILIMIMVGLAHKPMPGRWTRKFSNSLTTQIYILGLLVVGHGTLRDRAHNICSVWHGVDGGFLFMSCC